MLPPMDTSATRGQANTADQCELANDPEPTRQRLCTSKPDTTVPPIAFYGPDRPTCQTLPWHRPQSQRALLAFNPSGSGRLN